MIKHYEFQAKARDLHVRQHCMLGFHHLYQHMV